MALLGNPAAVMPPLADRLMWKSLPLGAKESQGSDARRYALFPEQTDSFGITTEFQDWPPSLLTPATSPREPPSDQRSCCQVATMLSAFVGFTSTQGSTSVLAKFVPVCPESAVHDANGLAPETFIGVETVKRPAHAIPAASAPAVARSPTRKRSLFGMARISPFDCTRRRYAPA